tara:strand:- start:89 stop:502 length:414 start_codon:yes stop_codon:yes gene_type:complete
MNTPFKLKGHTLPGPFKQYVDPTPTQIGIKTAKEIVDLNKPFVNPTHVQDLTEVIKAYDAAKAAKAAKNVSRFSKVMKFLGSKLFGTASFVLGAHSASAQPLTEKKKIIDYSKIIGNLPVEEKSKRTKEQVVVESAD